MHVPTSIKSVLACYASVRMMRKRGIRQCVCVSVCVDCYSCSRINEVQVRVSIGFQSCFLGWQWLDLQNKALFLSYAYLECHCSPFRRVRSKICSPSVATLLSSQPCTRTLAIGSCRVRRELQGSADLPLLHELLASIVFNNNHGQSLPTI